MDGERSHSIDAYGDAPVTSGRRAVLPRRKRRLSDDRRFLAWAVTSLRQTRPEFSAAEPLPRWQRAVLAGAALALGAGAIAAPRAMLSVLFAALALPFFCVVLLRAVALWHWSRRRPPTATGASAAPLQSYTILVPLYREAGVVLDLVSALSRIDYPHHMLQILLIVESIDRETQAALKSIPLGPHMRIVTVPDGAPRTKPRALNFALAQAIGTYVVVYDAEDVPEPDQLKRAHAMLAADPTIGCVQARLNIYNCEATWLTRGLMAQTPERSAHVSENSLGKQPLSAAPLRKAAC